MTYILDWANPAKSKIVIADRSTNTSTSLTFVGRHAPNYGEVLQENVLRLLDNFASVNPPANPSEGQLWFNLNSKKVQVFHTGQWNDMAIYASPVEPNPAFEGQLWYDELSDELKIFDGYRFVALVNKREYLNFVQQTNDNFTAVDARQTAHESNYAVHLTSAQNTWIDAITATSTEVNYLSGVTSNVQTQFNTQTANLNTHKADYTVHLTSAQNTWIDAITATATEVNYLSGVTSGVQTQFNTLTTNLNTHKADYAVHLTAAQNTWIDAITASSAEVNYLVGVRSGVQQQLDSNAATAASETATKVAKAGDTMTGYLTLVGDPINALHAVTKQYVDNMTTGLDFKQSCKAATTVNIALSGVQTIDGILLSVGDRVLVKNQTTKSQNGIYIVQAGAWTRAGDADNTPGTEVSAGLFVFIESGTLQADSGWVLATNGTIAIGSTDLDFVQFTGLGQVTAGAGLTKTNNIIDVATASASRIVVNTDNIDLATTGIAAGTYTKVTYDIYGRAVGFTTLAASDIPGLDWSKIVSGIPTTLDGYGISDAAPLSHVSNYTLHLTSAQNTWLDAITATSAEVNYLSGVTSSIQTQINAKVAKSGDTMTGPLNFGNNLGISWSANTDTGAIYFESSGDAAGLSNLILEVGDNGDEGWVFRTNTTGTKTTTLKLSPQSFMYKTYNVYHEGNLSAALSTNNKYVTTLAIGGNGASSTISNIGTIFAGITEASDLMIQAKIYDSEPTSRTYQQWINSEAVITVAASGQNIVIYNDYNKTLQVKITIYKL